MACRSLRVDECVVLLFLLRLLCILPVCFVAFCLLIYLRSLILKKKNPGDMSRRLLVVWLFSNFINASLSVIFTAK